MYIIVNCSDIKLVIILVREWDVNLFWTYFISHDTTETSIQM